MPDLPPDIDRLIGLYLSRRATEQERQTLMEWVRASPRNRQALRHLERIWHTSADQELPVHWKQLREDLWQAGTSPEQPRTRPIHRTIYWKVAAVLLMTVAGAIWFWYLASEEPTSSPVTITWIEKVNPAGQRSQHQLPDGTHVWLNAASRLRFPSPFTDSLRRVQLQGEAFFEVVPNPQQPFVVVAAGTQTEAIGTAFNVYAYSEDSLITISLLEGKVQVSDANGDHVAVLSPGEALLAPHDQSAFRRQPFDYEKTFGWKDGILIFDGASFADFRRAIEKWYGVQVAVEGHPPTDWSLRARYQREDLRHVLRDVGFHKKIDFELTDKNVLITF